MPANLTPEYRKAEQWYKSASSESEKILALEEMLRTIPKHKGTDHMQADLKSKLSKLRANAQSAKKKGGKHVDVFHVPKSGAGQVVLIGTPNCGKSSIVGALSNANVNTTDYPFATQKPTPGMAKYQDISIELVDMPPITEDYAAPGQVQTYRGGDITAIVIDLSQDVEEQMMICLDFLESHKLLPDNNTGLTDSEGNTLARKTFVIGTKTDIATADAIEKLKNSTDRNFQYVPVSTEKPESLQQMLEQIFKILDIVRIYAKKPGKPADMTDPFTLPRGSTIQDLAYSIHRELAEKLKSARAWGAAVHDGQNVHRTYVLNDKDIIELHF